MRDEFSGYYPPTEAEFDQLWSDGLLVLDTNALLSLYRLKPTGRDQWLQVMGNFADRLWMPYQVGVEFHRNRAAVWFDVQSAFDKIEKGIDTARDALKSHPVLESDFKESLTADLNALSEKVKGGRDANSTKIPISPKDDQIWSTLIDLFDGKVGPKPADADHAEMLQTAKDRFDKKIPPGYEDKDKQEPERYGDTVIWLQTIAHAKLVGKPVIFITDDAKEDWWYVIKGMTIHARPELVREFREQTDGLRISIYRPDQFLRFAKNEGSDISEATIDEVSDVSTSLTKAEQHDEFQAWLERGHAKKAMASQDVAEFLKLNLAEGRKKSWQMRDIFSEQEEETSRRHRRSALRHELESLNAHIINLAEATDGTQWSEAGLAERSRLLADLQERRRALADELADLTLLKRVPLLPSNAVSAEGAAPRFVWEKILADVDDGLFGQDDER